MNTSIEKQQGPVSNGNCYLRSKTTKNINQAISLLVASQRENFNVNSDNNINDNNIARQILKLGFKV